ncbi:MAG: PHP domain-containing protein [Halanaerobiales bacterium]|nr:PHP domain-containing protein [Halanaerobiales bacterium]
MYNIKADLHTHTVNSGHGYSTVDELARTASKKDIELIAVTEHGPSLPGGPHRYFFSNMSILPEEMYGVKILKGIEANIGNKGKLDLNESDLKSLDFVAAGLHYNTGHTLSNKKEYTKATVEAIKNPLVNMITHPASIYYPLDLEKVVKAASMHDVILEVNAGSFHPKKKGARGNKNLTIKLCKLARKHGVLLSLNSDAHFHTQVGQVHHLFDIIKEAGITDENLINTSIDKIETFLEDNRLRKISV